MRWTGASSIVSKIDGDSNPSLSQNSREMQVVKILLRACVLRSKLIQDRYTNRIIQTKYFIFEWRLAAPHTLHIAHLRHRAIFGLRKRAMRLFVQKTQLLLQRRRSPFRKCAYKIIKHARATCVQLEYYLPKKANLGHRQLDEVFPVESDRQVMVARFIL